MQLIGISMSVFIVVIARNYAKLFCVLGMKQAKPPGGVQAGQNAGEVCLLHAQPVGTGLSWAGRQAVEVLEGTEGNAFRRDALRTHREMMHLFFSAAVFMSNSCSEGATARCFLSLHRRFFIAWRFSLGKSGSCFWAVCEKKGRTAVLPFGTALDRCPAFGSQQCFSGGYTV